MNDDQLQSGLGTALREYADDIHPDLDALVRTSRSAGGRIRLRRRIGVSVGAVAAVAGIIGVASIGGALSGASTTATQQGPGFAGQPTAPRHAHRAPHRLHSLGGGSHDSIYRGQSVTIHLAGWRQVGPIADDKQTLDGPGGAVADIVWRLAADHHEWVTSPDKGNVPGVWVSDVHDGVFVSIQGGSGTTDADIQALGASLTWN